MPINTIIPIAFALLYLSYVFIGIKRANKYGTDFRYKPGWILISFLILGLCIYALATGQAITDFLG